MDLGSFREMYKTELQEAYSLETQLVRALSRMITTATEPDLKRAIQLHLEETRQHQHRLELVLRRHGAEPREHTDQSMQAIIHEAEKWAAMLQEPELRDAGLIASAQRIEHYEITVYGTLATWAKRVGFSDDLHMLLGILEEEKHADDVLSNLAKSTINPHAAAMAA
jgi:ferritin-like metal-binding protein YciE